MVVLTTYLLECLRRLPCLRRLLKLVSFSQLKSVKLYKDGDQKSDSESQRSQYDSQKGSGQSQTSFSLNVNPRAESKREMAVKVLKGIKVHQAKSMPGRQIRLPVTPKIMRKLRLVWEANANEWNNIMF